MDILKKFNDGKKMTARKLAKIAHEYFYKYKPSLPKNFHKKIDIFAKKFMEKEKFIKKWIQKQ